MCDCFFGAIGLFSGPPVLYFQPFGCGWFHCSGQLEVGKTKAVLPRQWNPHCPKRSHLTGGVMDKPGYQTNVVAGRHAYLKRTSICSFERPFLTSNRQRLKQRKQKAWGMNGMMWVWNLLRKQQLLLWHSWSISQGSTKAVCLHRFHSNLLSCVIQENRRAVVFTLPQPPMHPPCTVPLVRNAISIIWFSAGNKLLFVHIHFLSKKNYNFCNCWNYFPSVSLSFCDKIFLPSLCTTSFARNTYLAQRQAVRGMRLCFKAKNQFSFEDI